MTAAKATIQRFSTMLAYRGREGQWSWLVHRIGGLGILAFLLLHVVDIWVMLLGREAFNHLLIFYHWAPFKVLTLFLIFSVLFHAVNGLRIIIIDFVPGATRYHRQLFWWAVAIVVLVMVPATVATIRGLF